MARRPSPEELKAQQIVLEGGFAFYGLISALPHLPTPLHAWQSQTVQDNGSQTVRCGSVRTLPHGPDALVLQALLMLYDRDPRPDRQVTCTGQALREAVLALAPNLWLTDEQLHQSLLRLMGVKIDATWRPGPGRQQHTIQFGLLNDLALDVAVQAEVVSLITLTVALSSRTLRLGQLDDSTRQVVPVQELLTLGLEELIPDL
ncbi:hypothetical protein V3W47_14135 [Deinococcus sp. YIM 134068]|uniref:hypothetical protein n=1 Tax=Deinococcus lichenicola TaxID=3118910 RepID=UPI002F93F4F9